MNVMITGATGFVGRNLIERSLSGGYRVRMCSRKQDFDIPYDIELYLTGDISNNTEWYEAVQGVDVVIHTAARVHVMADSAVDPLTEFRSVNVAGTLNLAQQAAEAGVKRFIFISSIKVNGEETLLGSPFKEEGFLIPTDPYGLSKYEAEKCLLNLAKKTDMEVVIIRPPLVYGPGVKANFASMMKWINKGVPLPFGSIHNQRSFVALDNLVSFIIHCIDHPQVANEIFLISDGEDVSTTELLRKVAKAFGKKALLIPIPVWLMTSAAKLVGKSDVANRLFGSLQVDSSKARELLGWKPVITMDEQLKKIADEYLNEKNA